MKGVISIDKNYKKPFYPHRTFDGLSIAQNDALAEVQKRNLAEVQKRNLADSQEEPLIALCGDFVQLFTFDKDDMFAVVIISKLDRKNDKLINCSYFATSFRWSKKAYPVKIAAVHLTVAGEVIIEGNVLDNKYPNKDVSIEFQDIGFFDSNKPYKIGDIYNFSFSGIAYRFIKQSEKDSFIKTDEELTNKEISSAKVDSIIPENNAAACATIIQPFSGFHEPPFRTSFSENNIQIYDYHYEKGPIKLDFPISIGENILGEQKLSFNDPVNIGVVIQGIDV